MKNILVGLWSGELCPCDEKSSRYDETIELVGYIDRHTKTLNEQLNDKGKETLEKLNDCHGEILGIDREEAFIQGFSYGVRFLIEALSDF